MAPPVVALPKQFSGATLSRLAAQVVYHARNGWPEEMVFDFGDLQFIRPAGVVFLSNLFYWLNEQGTRPLLRNTAKQLPALFYLDDSLFFEQHCGSKVRPRSSPRATTRPLMRIAHKDSHAWLQTNLVPWLATRLKITEASLYSMKACVSEIFNNIQDHTRYDIGSIFVQHFPHENTVTISVSDFGLGIPGNVQQKLPELTDDQAILQAVKEGFTTKSKPGNQGAGLDYLLRTVVAANGGEVTFYSCGSIVRFYRAKDQVKPFLYEKVGFCPGTTIDINLRTDAIEVLPNEPEELTW